MLYLIFFILVIILSIELFALFGYYMLGSKGYTAEELCRLKPVAHRAGGGVYENTLSGVEKCLAEGVSEIEIDVRMTADGELVVCHDATIGRTTVGNGEIGKMQLNDIRKYSLKCSSTSSLPTLGEVFELVDGRCRLLIDAKENEDAEMFAKAIINEVALYQAADWVSVQSFDDAILGELHRLGHPFPLEKLFVFKIPGLPFIVDNGISYFDYSKYDYISSFNVCYRMVFPGFVSDAHKRGKNVKIWSPDIPADTPTLPVDGVITACPSLWKRCK